MAKIAFIGAGSTVFARNLLRDLFTFPELHGAEIALMDIDPERLRATEIVANRVAERAGARPTIVATTDRRRALDGADYAICMIQVGGYRPGTVTDFEIPKKYGLRQTIADTLGIGGIMRGLRTIPVLLDMCSDMEELCPDVTFLQYVNPMAMNCWAIGRASKIKTIGLCHSVQGTAGELARDIGVPLDEINYVSAGINHMAFYLRFERDGEDLYPRIRQVIDEGRVPSWNRVRYELFRRVGYFVTESSEHFSEYVPWFIKRDRPELVERFNIPLDEYIRRCEVQIAGWEGMRAALEDPDVVEVMLNPDRTLWIDRLSSGRAPMGVELSEADGERIIRLVAAHVGAEVHRGQPLLTAELPETGERFEGILPPAAPGPAFALRKRAFGVIPLSRYIEDGMMTAAQAGLLVRAVRERQNILIAGGTSTGKTTLANALLAEIAATGDRVLVLEDTVELQCAARDHVPLRTRQGVVSMTDVDFHAEVTH